MKFARRVTSNSLYRIRNRWRVRIDAVHVSNFIRIEGSPSPGLPSTQIAGKIPNIGIPELWFDCEIFSIIIPDLPRPSIIENVLYFKCEFFCIIPIGPFGKIVRGGFFREEEILVSFTPNFAISPNLVGESGKRMRG